MFTDISQIDYASALGIGHDLSTHTEILDVVQCFHGVRKEIERQKSMLSSATVAQLKRRQTLLPENVARSIQEDKYRRLLLPLIIEQPTVESLNNYIIACLVLTEHRVDRLARCGLLDVFHQLFENVIGTINAQSTAIDFIDTMVIETLRQIETPSSRQLQEIFQSTRNGRPAKRPCLDRRSSTTPESTQNVNIGQDEILVLEPELLQDLSDEVDPSQPPPVDGPRHVVMQLTGAIINRLEALLGPDSPLLQAIKSSLQWRWERAREESLRTDCIIAMIPASEMQDFSIVIKVGYAAGRKISDYLRYGSSITMTTTLPQ